MFRSHIRRGRLPLVCALLLACGLLAACGSSSSSSTTSSTTAASTSGAGGAASSAARSSFRKCLQQHGVTLPNRRPGNGAPPAGGNGAPPYGGGGFFGGGGGSGGGGGGGLANNPKLAAAFKACGGNRFPRGGAGRFRLSHAAVTKFVTCVRQHGFNMPSPNFSGTGPTFPSSIRTNPKFVSASKACASLLRPTGAPPAGTSTTPATS